MSLEQYRHVHFVGVGGIGMSAIAQVLAAMGVEVSGSDLKESAMTRRLQAAGIRVQVGHAAEHVQGADLVIYSSAVHPDNPELAAALAAGIPLWKRAQMLGELLNNRRSVVITGTHGKTTTTSMVAAILERAGLRPTSIIGGELNDIGGNAKLGDSDIAVAEGDESDGSFVYLRPTIALVNNVDADHLDYYAGIDDVVREFERFLDGTAKDGLILLSADCPRARRLGEGRPQRVAHYGLAEDADYTAAEIRTTPAKTVFRVLERGHNLGELSLRMPGLHNVHNSLGAVGAARELGVSFNVIAATLADMHGPRRRFELVGEQSGVTIIDDYAHHPTEISATLAAFAQRYAGRRIGVFQPHRYTRTAKLLAEFGTAFDRLDAVILTNVYAAGEAPIPEATGRALYERVRRHTRHTVFVDSLDDAAACVLDLVQPGDAVITMGAGDVWRVGKDVLDGLEASRA